jgi:hypothetical protein
MKCSWEKERIFVTHDIMGVTLQSARRDAIAAQYSFLVNMTFPISFPDLLKLDKEHVELEEKLAQRSHLATLLLGPSRSGAAEMILESYADRNLFLAVESETFGWMTSNHLGWDADRYMSWSKDFV